MKRSCVVLGLLLMVSASGAFARGAGQSAEAADSSTRGNFVLRSTDKSPDDAVAAIQAYAEQRKWAFLGADKVKQGEVTLVKVCIPDVGKLIWSVGLELSAMLPCGNLGVYRKGGRTEISLLHPRYMQMLHPHPVVEKASAMAGTQFVEMLDAVAK